MADEDTSRGELLRIIAELRGQVAEVEIVDDSQELSPMVEAEIGYFYSEFDKT